METKKQEELPVLKGEDVPALPSISVSEMSMAPLIELAAKGVPMESIKEIVQLYREERAHMAETAYNEAFAKFQSECPPIPHNRTAKGATKSGGTFEYTYAETAQIAKIAGPFLHKNGLSYSWRDEVKEKMFHSVCVIRHKDGHSRDGGSFVCPIDFDNKLQSAGQATKVGQTIAHRCSLISALGITTADTDDDGAEENLLIGPGQEQDLESLCTEVNGNKALLLGFFKAAKWADLTVAQYPVAVRMLEAKRRPS